MSKKKEGNLKLGVIYVTDAENIYVDEIPRGFKIKRGKHTSYISNQFPVYHFIKLLLSRLNGHGERLIKIIDSDACKPFRGDGRNAFDIIDDTLKIKE